MKKWLSPLLLASCLLGVGIAAAEAKEKCNCDSGVKEKPLVITNVDAITTAPLHVRSGPGKHYKSRDILPPDFPLVVGSCTRTWCQVYYSGGMNGWSYLPYLAFKEGGKHYNDPNLGPFGNGAMAMGGPRKMRQRHHRVTYSVNGGAVAQYDGYGRGRPAGWWTNYHRPTYHRAWQPRWWQKK